MNVVRLFLRYAARETVIAFLLAGLGGLLSCAAVLKLQAMLGSRSVTLLDAALLAALGLAQIVANIGGRLVFARGLYEKVLVELRRAVVRAASMSTLRGLEKCGQPRVWAAIDVNPLLIGFGGNALVMAGRSVATATACVVAMTWKAPALLPYALVAVAIGVGLFGLVSRKANRERAMTHTLSEVVDRHVEGLTKGNRELRQSVARQGAFLSEGLLPAIRDFQDKAASTSVWSGAATRVLGIPMMALVGGILFLSAAGTGQLSAFRSSIVVLLFLQAELIAVLGFLDPIQRAELALGRTNGVLAGLRTAESREAPPPEAAEVRWSTVALEQVTSTYASEDGGRQFTLGPVDLTLSPGEIVFVVGGNGSGKSTLAKILTGLYAPDKGAVKLDGKVVDDQSRESYRQLFTAVFANHHVYKRLYGIEGDDVDGRAGELLRALELHEKVGVKDGVYSTTALSSGQRKRLSMVTARLEDRRVLVFDEWASDQDPRFRDLFYRSILPELKKEGRTVIVVSHDDRYFDVADRLLRLEDGNVVYDGKPPARASSRPPPQLTDASPA